jgi:hypothetical protein
MEGFKELNNIICLPLYLYDHSGITMNTTGFSCPWDSGWVGLIYVTKQQVREEYDWKVITESRRKKIEEYLTGEVETYDQYLTGDVYGYEIIRPDGSEDESCWGYFGSDHEALLEDAKGRVDHEVDYALKNEGIQQELALA